MLESFLQVESLITVIIPRYQNFSVVTPKLEMQIEPQDGRAWVVSMISRFAYRKSRFWGQFLLYLARQKKRLDVFFQNEFLAQVKWLLPVVFLL